LQVLSQNKVWFLSDYFGNRNCIFCFILARQFYRFEYQKLIWTMPIYCIEWQRLPRTIATRVD